MNKNEKPDTAPVDAVVRPRCGKLWAVKMLFLWRIRLGYWDWDAFEAAWND